MSIPAIDRTGVTYNPLADSWRLSPDMDVNYMIAAEKRAIAAPFAEKLA